MSIEFHRAAIAFHQAEIDKLTGVPPVSGFDQNDFRTWWPAMIEQAANNRKPHAWQDWGPGNPLPENVGNNERESPLYEGAKPFWMQMERQKPPVLDSNGERFNQINIVRRDGWAGFEKEVRRLWSGDEGHDYRLDVRNDGIWQRIKV